jgi:hypothetical protein
VRTALLGLAGVGIVLGLGAYVVNRRAPPEPPAITAEVVGLPNPIRAGGQQLFAVRVRNPSREAVEVIGLDGLGCQPAGCLGMGEGADPLGRVIPAGGTLDVPLTVSLRGPGNCSFLVQVYLRSAAGLVTASVDVGASAVGPDEEDVP